MLCGEMKDTNNISKLDSVVLLKSIPPKKVWRGDVGCVVEVHKPDIYEIEFVDENGNTKALVTLPGSDVMRLNLNIAATT